MTQQSLVSVLIPCYNSAPWLAETLESALSQTHSNIELIIIDDGSTDDSLAIAQEYECSNVKVISQKNQGQCAAENRALRVSQGDFIQYLDADDLLAPHKIERQLAMLSVSEPDCVASGEWARFYRTPQEAIFKPQLLWRDLSPVDWLVCAWENHLMMHGAAWLIPREVAVRAGSWDERLSLINDFDYFSRILLASRGVRFCKGAKTYYRSGNTSSLSASTSAQARQSQFLSLNLGVNTLLNAEESHRTRRTCATVFQRFIYETYPQVPELRAKATDRVNQLGGSTLQPSGGPAFQFVSKVLGWQQTKRIQNCAYELGYNRAAFGWKLAKLKERIAYNLQLRKRTQSNIKELANDLHDY